MAHFYAIWGANIFETFCDTFILPKTHIISRGFAIINYTIIQPFLRGEIV